MKSRLFFIAVLFVLAVPAATSAAVCGTGGTCKASCDSNTETQLVTASSVCPLESQKACCIPKGAVCATPGLCQSGPTTARSVINPDPNINCGSSGDKCYIPCTEGQSCSLAGGGTGRCVASEEGNQCIQPASPTATSPVQTSPGGGNPTQTSPGGSRTNVKLFNPLNTGDCSANGNCFFNFLLNILDIVIRIGEVFVILMLVFVGFKFVAARGNPEDIKAARTMLLWTLVGALILLGAKAIALGVKATVEALSI